jgi:hypothetical protein
MSIKTPMGNIAPHSRQCNLCRTVYTMDKLNHIPGKKRSLACDDCMNERIRLNIWKAK